MTILICSVGGSPDPVVHCVQANEPRFTYFLCSKQSAETIDGPVPPPPPESKKHDPRSIAERTGLTPDRYEVVEVDDPDELEPLMQACERIQQRIAERSERGQRIVVNYTGGTKSMSAALALLALSEGWDLQIQKGPRPNLKQVISGDAATALRVESLNAKAAIKQAKVLAERMDFSAAVEVLEDAVRHLRLTAAERAPLDGLLREYRMRAAWDRFDHAAALEIAQANPTDARERFASEIKKLKKLERIKRLLTGGETWGPEDVDGRLLVEDLIENAKRCATRGRYDDAVGRLYRATELLAQVQLKRKYGVSTADVNASALPLSDEARARLESSRGRNGKVAIGLRAAYQLLQDLGDPLGNCAAEPANEDALRKFMEKRNHSLFAHGVTPIDAETWLDMGEAWVQWLQGAIASAR